MTGLFHGLSAFPLTPTDGDGRADLECQGTLLDGVCKAGVDSIGLLGSTGVYAYLTIEERQRVVEAAVRRIAGRVPLLVGVGALRTDVSTALARHAANAGADGLFMAPVSYNALTDREAFEHYRAVAKATNLPLCVYNAPATTHFTFSDDLLVALGELPNVAAVKMPGPADRSIADEIHTLRPRTGIALGYSGDWQACEALLRGADCWFSVIAGLLPRLSLQLARAAQAGRTEEAERIDAAFEPLWETFRTHGSLRVAYTLLEAMELGDADPPRPLLPLEEAAQAKVREAAAPLIFRERELAAI